MLGSSRNSHSSKTIKGALLGIAKQRWSIWKRTSLTPGRTTNCPEIPLMILTCCVGSVGTDSDIKKQASCNKKQSNTSY